MEHFRCARHDGAVGLDYSWCKHHIAILRGSHCQAEVYFKSDDISNELAILKTNEELRWKSVLIVGLYEGNIGFLRLNRDPYGSNAL